MTSSQIQKYRHYLEFPERLEAELAKRHFIEFVKLTKKDYIVNWHHQLLAEYLQAFAKGEIKKLMVFMPPQHGKSELTSRRFPAYLLGLNPALKIVGASYSSDLATSFNRDVQRIIDDEIYSLIFPDTFLNSKNVKTSSQGSFLRNADIFETVGHRGFYKSVGVGGSLTGTSVDIAIIDDPVKDAVEAQSLTDQSRKWEWYTNVLETRLHNNSQQLITMTRWHKQDLCGKILQSYDDWEVLHLEAIKEKINHPKDAREWGQALWPDRHSKEKIMRLAKANPATFDALYQGNPQTNKSMLYATGFNYTSSVKEISEKKYLPLHYTVDFNTAPYMSGLAIQIEFIKQGFWNNYTSYWELRVLKQFALKSPKNDAQSLGREFEQFYPRVKQGFFLYGDASGNNNTGISSNSDTIKTKTLFSDLLDGLSQQAQNLVIKRIPNKNPSYRSIGKGMLGRRVFLNQLLNGGKPVRILIHPSCNELIEDLKECKQDANGKLAKPKNRQGIEERGHLLQAFEYFICHPDSVGYLAKLDNNE